MNEAAFWVRVRAALNDPATGTLARKLSDAFTAGTPDCFYVLDRRMGLLELKYVAAWPARATTLLRVGVTPEQRRYLTAVAEAGAPAHILLGVADTWYLLNHHVPDRVAQHDLRAIVWQGTIRTLRTTLPRALRACVADHT